MDDFKLAELNVKTVEDKTDGDQKCYSFTPEEDTDVALVLEHCIELPKEWEKMTWYKHHKVSLSFKWGMLFVKLAMSSGLVHEEIHDEGYTTVTFKESECVLWLRETMCDQFGQFILG